MQVKSMQLEGTLYSEQFYAQNILLCLLGTINIFKIILPSPSNYLKRKPFKYIQVWSLYWTIGGLCYDLSFIHKNLLVLKTMLLLNYQNHKNDLTGTISLIPLRSDERTENIYTISNS